MRRKRKVNRKTNPRIIKLVEELKIKARENNAPIWKDIAKRLEKPIRNYAAVNISKINRYSNDKDMILVPGKVLSMGNIDHHVSIAALSFSKKAIDKIRKDGYGECISIEELIKKNPKGASVKIIA